MLRPFYCEVCEKQFQNVAQYDEHTNSYAHHHKVRFRDMQAAQRASRNTEEEVNKRKEKERKREEKELRKIAKAAGVKMVKPPVATVPTAPPPEDPSSSGFKKSGWATVATPAEQPKRGGWASVKDSQPASSSSGGWATASAAPPVVNPSTQASSSSRDVTEPHRPHNTSAPAFRTGGWTSLETSVGMSPQSTSSTPPPPPPASLPAPRPPPSNAVRSGWASISGPPEANSGWNAPPRAPPPLASAQLPPIPAVSPPAPEPVRQESSRSGWQKFRAGGPGRRR